MHGYKVEFYLSRFSLYTLVGVDKQKLGMKTTLGRSIKIRPITKLSVLLSVESATSVKMFLPFFLWKWERKEALLFFETRQVINI